MIGKPLLALVLISGAALAHALEVKPYSPASLAAAQQTGQPVALHFRADWCPTCRAQDAAIQSLKPEPGLDLTVLAVNYDTEKALKRQFNVQAQSTLIVLHGKQERARLVGETSAAGIRQALKTAF